MSNQVFSNLSLRYPFDGSTVTIAGLPLTSYIDQAVRTTSNVVFNTVAAVGGVFSVLSTADLRNSTSINISPGNVVTYQLQPTTQGTGLREVQQAFKSTTNGTSAISLDFTSLNQAAGTIEIQTQFISTAGPSVGQYGSYRQLTRFTNSTGTVTVGSNLQFLQQRDAGLVTASIALTGGANSLNVQFIGVAGEAMTWTGTVKIYQ